MTSVLCFLLFCFLPLLEIGGVVSSALVIHNSEQCMVVEAASQFCRFVIPNGLSIAFSVSKCLYTRPALCIAD